MLLSPNYATVESCEKIEMNVASVLPHADKGIVGSALRALVLCYVDNEFHNKAAIAFEMVLKLETQKYADQYEYYANQLDRAGRPSDAELARTEAKRLNDSQWTGLTMHEGCFLVPRGSANIRASNCPACGQAGLPE